MLELPGQAKSIVLFAHGSGSSRHSKRNTYVARVMQQNGIGTLRMDLPLAAGYLVTVEPGLYFIPPLLNDPARRARYRDCVNWPLVEQHLHLGGVRIEDNVLVTSSAPEVLTLGIPKQL